MSHDNRHQESGSIRHPYVAGFVAFVGYYMVFQPFYNKIATGEFYPYAYFWQMLAHMGLNFIPIFMIFLADVAIIFRLNPIKDIRWKLPADFILANIAVFIIDLLFLLALFGTEYRTVNWAGTFFSNFIIFFAVEAVHYAVSFHRKAAEAERQKQIALRHRYAALKAQVTPHFLFNSLSILSALVNIDSGKAREFIGWLSRVYQYTLACQDSELSPLSEELSFMNSYVNILKVRYSGKFSVVVEGMEHVAGQLIPPYTLQLLIENITKHNTISAKHPMEVRVAISDEETRITNPINHRASTSPSHFGLRYLTELYRTYGKRFRIENDGKTFTAFIPYISDRHRKEPDRQQTKYDSNDQIHDNRE